MRAALGISTALIVSAAATGVQAQERRNIFDDPFVHVTQGIPDCPPPEPPGVTAEEARTLAHERSQRGVSCWLAGRCRLPNAYLYDKEIISRAAKALEFAGTYSNTSVWLLGQRRWIWIKGCVATQEQSIEIERLMTTLDDVEHVVNEVVVVPAKKDVECADSDKC